ncbi:MAG TPA: hypothetical protein VNN76_09010 [Bacteroidota bacterium]|nr:hypothetical protein [Bacteroidota bacterium]
MTYTYDQLSKMTVSELREIAKSTEREEFKGVATMHKEKLLPLLCKALKIEIPHHHVVGINKTEIKQKIRALKIQRDEAMQKKEREKLRAVRAQIHELKRELRKHMV